METPPCGPGLPLSSGSSRKACNCLHFRVRFQKYGVTSQNIAFLRCNIELRVFCFGRVNPYAKLAPSVHYHYQQPYKNRWAFLYLQSDLCSFCHNSEVGAIISHRVSYFNLCFVCNYFEQVYLPTVYLMSNMKKNLS